MLVKEHGKRLFDGEYNGIILPRVSKFLLKFIIYSPCFHQKSRCQNRHKKVEPHKKNDKLEKNYEFLTIYYLFISKYTYPASYLQFDLIKHNQSFLCHSSRVGHYRKGEYNTEY